MRRGEEINKWGVHLQRQMLLGGGTAEVLTTRGVGDGCEERDPSRRSCSIFFFLPSTYALPLVWKREEM